MFEQFSKVEKRSQLSPRGHTYVYTCLVTIFPECLRSSLLRVFSAIADIAKLISHY